MRASVLFILLSVMLAGCREPTRFYQKAPGDAAPTFEFAVIETPYDDVREKTTGALSPYFTITSRAETRVGGTQDKTMVVEVNGSRGITGSSALIMLRRFDSVDRDSGRLVYINQKAGIFWTGYERAMVKALRQLDEEAAILSAKLKSKKP